MLVIRPAEPINDQLLTYEFRLISSYLECDIGLIRFALMSSSCLLVYYVSRGILTYLNFRLISMLQRFCQAMWSLL